MLCYVTVIKVLPIVGHVSINCGPFHQKTPCRPTFSIFLALANTRIRFLVKFGFNFKTPKKKYICILSKNIISVRPQSPFSIATPSESCIVIYEDYIPGPSYLAHSP